jgi:hypothetical protein
MKRFNPYSIVLLCFLSSIFAVTLVASGFMAYHFAMRDVTRIEQLELIGE